MVLKQTFPIIYSAFLKEDFTVKHAPKCGNGVPLDQVLEKEYNKSTKGPSAVIGYTQRKESVRKWNIIRDSSLYSTCSLNDKGEHSFYYEISEAATEADEICVSHPENYISQRGNPFNNENQVIQSFATGTQLDKKASQC